MQCSRTNQEFSTGGSSRWLVTVLHRTDANRIRHGFTEYREYRVQEHIWVRRISVVNMYASGRSVHRPDSLALVWRMCLFRSVDHDVGIQSIALFSEYNSTESTL